MEDSKKIKPEPRELKVTRTQKESLRRGIQNRIWIQPSNPPIFKILVSDINKILEEEGAGENDTLVFALATYKTPDDFERYQLKEPFTGTFQEFINRPTILVAVEKNGIVNEESTYDVATIKPPPYDTDTQLISS